MEEEVYEPMTIYHGYPHKEISVLILIYITSLLQDGAEGNLVSSGRNYWNRIRYFNSSIGCKSVSLKPLLMKRDIA